MVCVAEAAAAVVPVVATVLPAADAPGGCADLNDCDVIPRVAGVAVGAVAAVAAIATPACAV